MKALLITLISVIVVSTGYQIYRQQTTAELIERITLLEQQNKQLSQHNDQLTEQQQQLTSDLQANQHVIAIQQATNEQLQQDLDRLHNDSIELNKELQFYQNITQGSTTTKLHIREFQLIAHTEQPGQFRYRLVISQGKKIITPLQGKLSLIVQGQRDNKAYKLEPQNHALNLRHIQLFDGHIALPEDMTPESIRIKIVQNKKTTLSETLDWAVTPNSIFPER